MKTLKYSFSHGDVEAVLAALSVLPAYGFEDDAIDPDSFFLLCETAGTKLATQQNPTAKETYLIAFAIDCACQALRGELLLDEDALGEIKQYFFTYQKLHPVFSPLLDM